MDLKKKGKPKFALKLDVQLDQITPEQQNTISVSAKKMDTDLFFSDPQPQVEDIDFNDFHQSFQIDSRKVADVCIKKGGRKSQQDRFAGLPKLDGLNNPQFFYGVFDGHGGSLISSILQKKLPVYLQECEQFSSNLEEAITNSFTTLNQKIFEIQTEKKVDCGSTALCVINRKDELFIANVGDSGCVLIKWDYTYEKLSREHKLTTEAEYRRVEPLCTILDRHQLPRINGEIAVTRSFGDKKYSTAGLIVEPEIIKRTITKSDRYLILATDGFWDILSLNDVKNLVQQWDESNQSSGSIEFLSSYLLDKASEKETTFKKDNMTLLTIDLQSQMKDVLGASAPTDKL